MGILFYFLKSLKKKEKKNKKCHPSLEERRNVRNVRNQFMQRKRKKHWVKVIMFDALFAKIAIKGWIVLLWQSMVAIFTANRAIQETLVPRVLEVAMLVDYSTRNKEKNKIFFFGKKKKKKKKKK